ncbi:MAG: hypothetical protein R3Y50_07635 [Rikenellaceae bacterium]
MKTRLLHILLMVMVVGVSCKRLSFPSLSDSELLASVGDKELYLEDVKAIFNKGISEKDSLDILQNYIDKWVKNQIKIERAIEQFEADSDDIERMIEEYRNSLLLNKYDNFHSINIDSTITESDIEKYYNSNKEIFRLSNPIVKGKIIRFNKNYRAEKELIKLLNSNKDNDKVDLADLIEKNDFEYREFTEWVYFTDMLYYFPLSEKKFDEFLKKNRSYEVVDGENKYVMVIDSYKNSGDYSPTVMVKGLIKKMIINNRKSSLLKQVEDSIYNSAVENKEIFINKKLENSKK